MQNLSSKRDPNAGRDVAQGSSSSNRPQPPRKIANGRFEIDKRLGAGCFGEVHKGLNAETKQEVAVKFEDVNARTQQLEQEALWMGIIRASSPVQPQGFSECFYFGREGRYHCMVMELLGKSLEDCVQQCKGKFTPLTTAMVGEQLIMRLEYLHSKGIVHRDIKPENFMWGNKGKVHHLYMIDFGLSKRYFEKAHVQAREKLSLTGTARYASINAHKGHEQSRRDDLEAVGHMLLYFLRGVLPWSGLDAKTKEDKYRKIRQKKEETPLGELCQGFPDQFQDYLAYARHLDFTERPDYQTCRKKFREVRDRLGPAEDYDLEWLKGSDGQCIVDVGSLIKLNVWQPPRQPDDDDPEANKKKGYKGIFGCFCSGKAPRDG
jgi:serine/threonine protein kinase